MALIGDRERERAAAFLRHCYVQGRISVDELAERLEVALSARRDSEMRMALADLPGTWRGQAAIGQGLETLSQSVRRVAFLVLVWSLWWAASLVLLIGFVASVVATGTPPLEAERPACADLSMDPAGLEPATFWLPARRSPS
jgi:hypothetical protein